MRRKHRYRRGPLLLTAAAAALVVASCTTARVETDARARQRFANPIEIEAHGLDVALVGILAAGHPDTLVEDPGWREYLLTIENRTSGAVVIHNAKLLNSEGRYLDSAATYAEINAPPEASEKIASGVARSTAGVVAGQLIPFGGYLVSVVSTAATAAASDSTGNAARDFALRKLKDVELAPAGRVSGSAFLPNILDPDALVVDYIVAGATKRAEIPLPKPGS